MGAKNAFSRMKMGEWCSIERNFLIFIVLQVVFMLYVGLCAGGWQPLGGDANLFLSLALSGCIGLVGVSVGIVSLRGKTERLGWVDWKSGCVLLVGIIIVVKFQQQMRISHFLSGDPVVNDLIPCLVRLF